MVDENRNATPEPVADQPESDGMSEMPTPLLPRLLSAIRGSGARPPGRWYANKWVRGLALLVVAILAVLVLRQGVFRVRENEVGVQVNNLTGELALKERVGYHFAVPYMSQFYVLDKTFQRLDLGWRQRGGLSRDIKLKTADGSNVSLDVTINFKLIPEKAVEVLRRSGQGTSFIDTWIEPFARHACFACFGQLTSEEIYDAVKRNEKAQAAVKELNERLGPYGIDVVAVIPGDFRFYREYEEVIQEKKLADQQVEEQQAQARAALQEQDLKIVEATKAAQSRLAAFAGECQNKLIQAKAEADKTKREAEGQYAATVLAADASLYTASKQAEAQKAAMLAEAEGMDQMRKAMAGDGGLSMVGLEYARRLDQIHFSATPIATEPSVHQFAFQPGVAAGAESAAKTGSATAGKAAAPRSETGPPRSALRGSPPSGARGPAELPRPARPVQPSAALEGGTP
jgi:regulator of protease activity HflC (stomatin/prohibitin superfamily)